MKKSIIIHPFLFAVYPIYFLYLYNIEKVSFNLTYLPLVITLCVTITLFLFANLFTKNFIKAGILVTAFLILFFSYGHTLEFLKNFDGTRDSLIKIGRIRYLLPVWFLLFVMVIFYLKNTKMNLLYFNKVLNIISSTLISLLLINTVLYKIKKIDNQLEIINFKSVYDQSVNFSNEDIVRELPDVYYIILDAYTSSKVLSEEYGFENIEFIEYLTKKGFYIASKSRSNYQRTESSLPSSLNMDYLQNLFDLSGDVTDYIPRLRESVHNNKVLNTFKSMKYKTINIGGDHQTYNNNYADLNINVGINDELINQIVRTSMLLHVDDLFGLLKRRRILKTFEELKKIPRMKEPTFTFAHILVPHGPFVFKANGEKIIFSKMFYEKKLWKRGATARDQYLDQLKFANQKTMILIDQIIKDSDIPPIIIVQGDHGPDLFMPNDSWPKAKNLTKTMLNEKTGILNAYYLPQCDGKYLYESISPVNSFRAIFNSCFDMEFNLLDDYYYYTRKYTSHLFNDITDRVKNIK